MQSGRRGPAPETRRAGYVPIVTQKSPIQRLNRGWGCETSDARMKLPSLSPDSAARFLRTVSFRLTTSSARSHPNNNSKNGGGFLTKTEQTATSYETGSGSPTGNDRSAFSGKTRNDCPTGNDQTTSFGDADKWPRTGNDQIPPSSGSQRGLALRSLSVAAFFRRAHSDHQGSKFERSTKREKDDATLGRSSQSYPSTSGSYETDSNRKRNFIFQGIGSIRIRNRNSVNYKSLDGGSRPPDVDTGRYSFRSKLRRDVQRHTLDITESYGDGTAKTSGTSRGTQRSVSDKEEEEQERSTKGQQDTSLMFQRSSALWRSFSAKSRTRSSDILSDATRFVADDQSISRQREEIELELKLLDDFQKHRRRLGIPEQHASQSFLSRLFDAHSQSSSTPTKGKLLGIKDLERYHQNLDRLYEFNVAHAYYTEAAFVLCEHAQSFCSAETGLPGEEREDEEGWLSWEKILLRAVEDFDLGRTWEYAIDICERLSKIYKARLMYAELSQLLRKQATLYRKILQEPRLKPCYFMVQFVGCGFPVIFTDRRFVLRTETLEDEYDLGRLITSQFNGIKRLCDSPGQHETATTDIMQRGYRLFTLKPIPSVSVSIPGSRKVPDAVQFFYRYNNVSCFEVVDYGDGEAKSVVSIESSLPAISRWAQVTSKTADV